MRSVAVLALVVFASRAAPAQQQRGQRSTVLPDAPHVLAFLNRTIAWNDRLDAQAQLAEEPTDVLYVNDNRQLARQVVALSFEAAKAEAQLLASSAAAAPAPSAVGQSSERLQRMAKRATSAAEVLRREQARLAELQRQLASAPAEERPRLEAAVSEAQSRVAVAQTRNDSLSGMIGLLSGAGGAASDLPSQIAALEQTVSASAASRAAALPVTSRKPPPSSVVGLIGDIIDLNSKASVLQSAIRQADQLQRDGRDFTSPLMAQLSQARQRAEAFMNTPDTADPAELLRRKTELDALNARLLQLSPALQPLMKRRILLDAYKANLGRWRASVQEQHRRDLRRLTFRAVFFGILLLIVAAVAVTWRRIAFRYVQDVKRRHHLLLIRRIVLLLLVAGILTATFASDFSSLTTFVGLLTAGIAIALQDVILSMAGYFVIIGKYGIRPGDRVRIAAVNGDVLDVAWSGSI